MATDGSHQERTDTMQQCNAFCINSDEGAIFFKSNQPVWEDAPKVNSEGSAIKGSYTCYGLVKQKGLGKGVPMPYKRDNVDPYCGNEYCLNRDGASK